ncbi:MAG: carboxylesterase/lipase family protein [Candidatus Obscuribacterales bacterium]|nr:carboxylesterase/lipase family protein [Steroidobacteraceae bacterium]
MNQIRITVVVAVSLLSAAAFAAPVKVSIDSGTLVGESNDGVNSFKGVPFAKPPVGDLRWSAPQKPDKWRGERDATQFQLPCPQPTNPDGKTLNGGGVSGKTAEDCLYLNVVAPANAKDAPVMVWLYGGASFLGGAHLGSYNAPTFAKNGVIIVTTNYRLGPLGSFAHPALTKAAKPNEPIANYALMDAVATLQWVQRNIGKFGGDTKNVTVFGQSAGGAMVVNLLGIPSAKGLFAKAGIQSGAALRPGMNMAAGEKTGSEWAGKMGLDANATMEQLRAIPVEKFATNNETARSMGSPIDGRFKTKSTQDAFADGSASYVPLIIGSNNGEGGFDGARAVATAMSAKAPVFLYQFAYVPEWRKVAQPQGAPHSAEIVYVFDSWNTTAQPVAGVAQVDRDIAKRVNSCWVAFAKAEAKAKSLTCADGFTWPAFTAANDDAAVLAAQAKMVKSKALPNGPPPGAPRGSAAPN